ncbi:Hypothetical predicted protein [Paramuricea clavata]|uniref:Uncharacterized protein n=1 Tax=Paramuricea clavata TaxID=317549 RepID=A0A7D9LCW7_PARCT|nr:Hypothetical predicted protein [Paramuricea clavata]
MGRSRSLKLQRFAETRFERFPVTRGLNVTMHTYTFYLVATWWYKRRTLSHRKFSKLNSCFRNFHHVFERFHHQFCGMDILFFCAVYNAGAS